MIPCDSPDQLGNVLIRMSAPNPRRRHFVRLRMRFTLTCSPLLLRRHRPTCLPPRTAVPFIGRTHRAGHSSLLAQSGQAAAVPAGALSCVAPVSTMALE